MLEKADEIIQVLQSTWQAQGLLVAQSGPPTASVEDSAAESPLMPSMPVEASTSYLLQVCLCDDRTPALSCFGTASGQGVNASHCVRHADQALCVNSGRCQISASEQAWCSCMMAASDCNYDTFFCLCVRLEQRAAARQN